MSSSALTSEVIFVHLFTVQFIRLFFGNNAMTQSNHIYTTPLYKLTFYIRLVCITAWILKGNKYRKINSTRPRRVKRNLHETVCRQMQTN